MIFSKRGIDAENSIKIDGTEFSEEEKKHFEGNCLAKYKSGSSSMHVLCDNVYHN